MNDQIASYIRTITPTIVGWITAIPLVQGILDQNGEINGALIVLVQTALTLLYYVVARLLETKVDPKFGWLLGLAKKPSYNGNSKALGE